MKWFILVFQNNFFFPNVYISAESNIWHKRPQETLCSVKVTSSFPYKTALIGPETTDV